MKRHYINLTFFQPFLLPVTNGTRQTCCLKLSNLVWIYSNLSYVVVSANYLAVKKIIYFREFDCPTALCCLSLNIQANQVIKLRTGII